MKNVKGLEVSFLSFIMVVQLMAPVFAFAHEADAQTLPEEGVAPLPSAGTFRVTSQDLGVENPTLLPTSPLYFLKNASRSFQSFLTTDPIKKAELKLQFADEKLVEARAVLEKKPDNEGAIKKAFQNYTNEVESLKNRLQSLQTISQNPNIDGLLEQVTDRAIKHGQLFDEILSKAGPEARSGIQVTQDKYLENLSVVSQKFDDSAKFTQKLEKVLNQQGGGDYKSIRSLEFIDRLGQSLTLGAQGKIASLREDLLTKTKGLIEELGSSSVPIFQKLPGDPYIRSKVLEEIKQKFINDQSVAHEIDDIKEGIHEDIGDVKSEKAQEMLRQAERAIIELRDKLNIAVPIPTPVPPQPQPVPPTPTSSTLPVLPPSTPAFACKGNATGWYPNPLLYPNKQGDSRYVPPQPGLMLYREVRRCDTRNFVDDQKIAKQIFPIVQPDGTCYLNYTCTNRYKQQCELDGSFDTFYNEACYFEGQEPKPEPVSIQNLSKSPLAAVSKILTSVQVQAPLQVQSLPTQPTFPIERPDDVYSPSPYDNQNAARQLLANAEKHLASAKDAFVQGKYGEAFGQANAAYANARKGLSLLGNNSEDLKEVIKNLEARLEKIRKIAESRGWNSVNHPDFFRLVVHTEDLLKRARNLFENKRPELIDVIREIRGALAKLENLLMETVPPQTGPIRVLNPNGGEKIVAGQPFTIKWAGGLTGLLPQPIELGQQSTTLLIRLLNSKGVSLDIARLGESKGFYNWTPARDLIGDGYKIRIEISGSIRGELRGSDESDREFSIVRETQSVGVLEGFLEAQKFASIQQWGTHTLKVQEIVYCVKAPCPPIEKTYLVKAANDSVLTELNRYVNQRVAIKGTASYQNLEGGFWGLVADSVKPISPNQGENHSPEIGPSPVKEPSGDIRAGHPVTFTFTGSDPDGDNLSWGITWGDGNGETGACPSDQPNRVVKKAHTFNAVGTYLVQVFVGDCRGGSDTISFNVKVISDEANMPPQLNPSFVPAPILINQPIQFVFSASDADNDNLWWSINWGDSPNEEVGSCPSRESNTTIKPSHTWRGVGTYLVGVEVGDCRGGYANTSFNVTVGQ